MTVDSIRNSCDVWRYRFSLIGCSTGWMEMFSIKWPAPTLQSRRHWTNCSTVEHCARSSLIGKNIYHTALILSVANTFTSSEPGRFEHISSLIVSRCRLIDLFQPGIKVDWKNHKKTSTGPESNWSKMNFQKSMYQPSFWQRNFILICLLFPVNISSLC